MMSRASAVVLACALAGCGGGGGSESPADSVRVTLDHSSITSIAIDDSAWTTDVVGISISGGSGEYYVAAASDNDTFETDLTIQSDTYAAAAVRATAAVNPGTTHTGHITYKLCTDSACSHVSWSRSLPYTITRFQVDTTPIAMSGIEGVAAAPRTLSVTPSDTGHLLTVASSDTGFLTVDHTDPAALVLKLATPHASSGVLAANVTISSAPASRTPIQLAQVPVAVTVNSDLVAPAISPIVITADSTAQGLAGTAAVSFAVPDARAWSASSDKPWLVLDSAAGNGAGTIRYHVDTTRLGGIANWSGDAATLSIASPGLSTLALPVTLAKQLPEVTVATPSAVIAGRATTVRVTGRGLSQLTNLTAFSVGGVAATGGSILSDTAATLQLPALPAGATSVSARNALALAAASAPLGVEASGTFAATLVPNNIGMNRAIAYDATRQAVYASNVGTDRYGTAGTLVRYQRVGSTWQVTTLPVTSIGSLALAPDRGTVYVVSGGSLLAVDPDTMQVRTTITLPDQGTASPGDYFDQPMPITSDQRLWIATSYYGTLNYYDLRSGSFGSVGMTPVADNPGGLYEPSVNAPASGDYLYVSSCTCSSPTGPSYWLSAATDSFDHSAAMPILNQVGFDAAGDLMLADSDTLYRTDTWTPLGHPTVTDSDPSSGALGAVLSPDGQRLYRQVTTGGYLHETIDHLEVFDTHATVAGGTDLVSLGSIALPDKATTCMATGEYFCDAAGRLTMDPTGTTLFWVGEQGLAVVPIPPAMSGISSAPRAHAAATGRLAGGAAANVRR
jgi:hypothetical protein